MIDVGIPEWVNDKDGYVLMKFFEQKQYFEDFLNGKLYFNTSDYFARCDEEGRGDPDEGNDFIVSLTNHNNISVNMEMIDGKAVIVARDYSKEPWNFRPSGIVQYSTESNRRRKLMSFYTAFCNISKNIIDIPSIKHTDEFGEYGIFITNRNEFFDRVIKKVKAVDKLQEAKFGFVQYINEPEIKGLYNWNPYMKRKKYSEQNEFRITYIDSTDKPCFLEVGDLKDIVFPIMKKDINELFFDDRGFNYPIYPMEDD